MCERVPPVPRVRPQVFREREALIQTKTEGIDLTCFATSIWDETLYTVRWRGHPCALRQFAAL